MNNNIFVTLGFLFFLPFSLIAQKDTLYFNDCEQQVKDKNLASYYIVRIVKNNFEQREGYFMSGSRKYAQSYRKLPFSDKNELVVVGYTTINGQEITSNQRTHKKVDSIFFRSGTYMEWFETGELKIKGSYFGDKLHDTLTTYHANRKTKRQEVYYLDTLKASRCFDSEGNEIPTIPYSKQAEYADGMKAMFQSLAQNIKYEKEARENRIGGTVMVELFICKDNSVRDIRIKNGVTKGLDAECLRVVKLLKKWKAAQKEGVNVASVVVLPIKFKLE